MYAKPHNSCSNNFSLHLLVSTFFSLFHHGAVKLHKSELEQLVRNSELCNVSILEATYIVTSGESITQRFNKVGILCEFTFNSILSLQVLLF